MVAVFLSRCRFDDLHSTKDRAMDFVLFQMPKLAVQPVLRNNVNIKRNISRSIWGIRFLMRQV